MMEKEFLMKLKNTLVALDKRLSAVEHLTNDVIIDGLKEAATEYADNEAYSKFVDDYGTLYNPLCEAATVIYGDDYDLGCDLYDKLKASEGYGSEGFDEAGKVNALISELQGKLNKLKEITNEPSTEEAPVENGEEVVVEEMPSAEQLAKEFKEYN